MINKILLFSKYDFYYYINCNVIYFILLIVLSYFKYVVLNVLVLVFLIFLDVLKLYEIVFF